MENLFEMAQSLSRGSESLVNELRKYDFPFEDNDKKSLATLAGMARELKHGYEKLSKELIQNMRFFKLREFNCKCCGQNEMAQSFLDRIDKARGYTDTPFVVTSGYRCAKHNEEIGSSSSSSHVRGFAADIKCTDPRKRCLIIKALLKAGFTRIGISEGFIHVDGDPYKPSNVIWTY